MPTGVPTFRTGDRMLRPNLAVPGFQNITQIVRILPPPPAWSPARQEHAKPQFFGDSRDSKNDSIWGARREMQCRRRHAPSCMGATELQSNWPDMRKTLGKPGEWKVESRAVLRTGQEPNMWMFFQCFREVRKTDRLRPLSLIDWSWVIDEMSFWCHNYTR